MLGITYLVIALARIASIVLDRSYERSNWISLAVEIVAGIVLLL
jgi:succinate dehydrogenase/fumarate reductase cytochrome b subunit